MNCGSLLKVAQARLLGGERDYKSKFDPKLYLAAHYSDNAYCENEFEFDLLHFQLESLQYIYQRISEEREDVFPTSGGGDRITRILIDDYDHSNSSPSSCSSSRRNSGRLSKATRRLWDVGSGPSLQLALGASLYFDELILSDVSDKCRREIDKFLEYDASAFDWTTIAKVVGELEGNVEDETVMERVREKVKEVVACNVLDSEIIPDCYGQFDVASCLFCLECACDTHRQYDNACRNIIKRLKRRGALILAGTLNSPFYDAGGGHMYRMLEMTKQEVTCTLEANHIDIRQWFEFQTPFDEKNSRPRASHGAVYFVCYGVKKK